MAESDCSLCNAVPGRFRELVMIDYHSPLYGQKGEIPIHLGAINRQKRRNLAKVIPNLI